MRWLVWSLVFAGGCVKPSTLTCGELTCEPGAVCTPDGLACTTQAQIDACFDADAPQTTCSAPGVENGVCRDGYCQSIVCGDQRTDPGEMCDDGNFVGGDGCSADCVSNEMCGNTKLDRGLEECDDGNTGAHDGCSDLCRLESPIWRQVVDTSFAGRSGHAMVYDSARKRIVMFGGSTSTGMSAETWEFDGDQWILRSPSVSPSARANVAMAYDPVRERTVLFGGGNGLTTYDQTWEWDGTSWTQKFPTKAPDARQSSAVAYHPGRGVVVLYGGSSSTQDTWEYDGTNWTQNLTAGTGPGKVEGKAMTYDPSVGGLVMFGAYDTTKTWKYDGTWTELTITGTLPRGRDYYSMAYDSSVGHTVMLGGADGDCGASTGCSDGFELVENADMTFSWLTISAPYAPSRGALAFDSDTAQLVAMGGLLSGVTAPQSTTMRRTKTDRATPLWSDQWNLLYEPPPRASCELAYLPALGGTVLFGGAVTNIVTAADATKTWLLRDGHWSRLSVATAPTTTDGITVLDRARKKLVRLDTQSSTWEFDGTTWTQATPATSPPARNRFLMVYDDARAAVVMFGGSDPVTKAVLQDTWTYDGSTWTLLPTATPAPATPAPVRRTTGRARRSSFSVAPSSTRRGSCRRRTGPRRRPRRHRPHEAASRSLTIRSAGARSCSRASSTTSSTTRPGSTETASGVRCRPSARRRARRTARRTTRPSRRSSSSRAMTAGRPRSPTPGCSATSSVTP